MGPFHFITSAQLFIRQLHIILLRDRWMVNTGTILFGSYTRLV